MAERNFYYQLQIYFPPEVCTRLLLERFFTFLLFCKSIFLHKNQLLFPAYMSWIENRILFVSQFKSNSEGLFILYRWLILYKDHKLMSTPKEKNLMID